jgi:hypothetical protein
MTHFAKPPQEMRCVPFGPLAAANWVETTVIKWGLWHDFVTWGAGVILGHLAMRLYRLVGGDGGQTERPGPRARAKRDRTEKKG